MKTLFIWCMSVYLLYVFLSWTFALARAGKLDVWLHDTPVIDYAVSRNNGDCALKKVLSFAVDSYGIAFSRNAMAELKVQHVYYFDLLRSTFAL